MRRILASPLALIALVLGCCRVAAGDVFILSGGGRVTGELLNRDEVPRETYAIRTSSGGRITLSRLQVKEWLRPRPAETEYEKIRPRYPDTVEGQWALAEWCRQNTLERDVHLQRVLELDPDHAGARRALGYFKRDGKWTTEKEVREKQGYVRYRGRWRVPQEIELLEEREEVKAAQGNWMKKLNQWRGWIGGNKTLLAYENIRRIDDPYAVPALTAALRYEPDDQARLAVIEALARIGTPGAKKVLAAGAIADPIPEVRLTCLDCLKKNKDPEIVRYFIETLRSEDNDDVNLAGVALREMGDPSAIGPLIDALVTFHKQKIPGGNPGQMTTTFGTGGAGGAPGGLALGDGGPKIISYYRNNQAVLDALVSLSGGVNYGFNVELWRAWHAAQKRSQPIDARRD